MDGTSVIRTGTGASALREQSALTDIERPIDIKRLRAYRLGRVQAELRRRDYGAALLYDPINIRYASGTKNMPIWTLHNAARYCFVPAEGTVVLFEFAKNCEHISQGVETVGEVRPGKLWFYYAVADRQAEQIERWADEIDALMRERCAGNRRLAIDRLDIGGIAALEARGLSVFKGHEPLERARCIKSPDELECIFASIAVCEMGLHKIQNAIEPGRTEIELWSILNHTNSEHGGEYIETRLLSSGPRTNPWFQECSNRRVRAGNLVAIDTDMIGPFGYNTDISRTFFCGPGKPTGAQRTIFNLSLEQLHHNIELLRPGVTFSELSERAWRAPDRYAPLAEDNLIHGIGMRNEYPEVVPPPNYATFGYDGMLEENMTVCVESYIGELGASDGVKLEQQVLITANGARILTGFPFDEALSGTVI